MKNKKKLSPYAKENKKFSVDDVNRDTSYKKKKEEVRNANRSLKKAVRQEAKNEIRKQILIQMMQDDMDLGLYE